MPSLKVKNNNGKWLDIASANAHQHTTADITDLPVDIVADVAALKDKVGSESVAYQIQAAIGAVNVRHPSTHPASMITGLADIAMSGSFNDLKDIPDNFGGTIVGSLASEEEIYAENTLNFEFLADYGAFHAWGDVMFALEAEQDYFVVWDDEEYQRTAFAFTSQIDGAECVAIGNPLVTGGEANEDKFAVVCDITHNYVHFFSTEELASHKVRIYKKIDIKMNWDNLLDKPFYEKVHKIVIDENTVTDVTFSGLGFTWKKVSPETLPEGTVVGSTASMQGMSIEISRDDVIAENDHGIGCLVYGQFPFLMVYKPGEATLTALGHTETVNIPETGTYMLGVGKGESYTFESKEIKKLDNKFLGILEGEDSEEIDIFPKQTVAFDSGKTPFAEIQQCPQLNKKYIVEFDGTEYECVAWLGEGICLGNTGFMGESYPDTGEPFVAASLPVDGKIVMAFLLLESVTETHEIRVYSPKTHMTVKSDNLPDPPLFDLVAMGLPDIPLDGTIVSTEYDVTEIREAAKRRPIKIRAAASLYGMRLTMESLVNAIFVPETEGFIVSVMSMLDGVPFICSAEFYDNTIQASAVPLAIGSLS